MDQNTTGSVNPPVSSDPAAVGNVGPQAVPTTQPVPATDPAATATTTAPAGQMSAEDVAKAMQNLTPEQMERLQSQLAEAAKANLAKYKMRFKGISYDQLMQLVKSSVLLENEDHAKFEQKYQSNQDPAELDKAFNVLFEEEYEYLEEEIAEMDKLLSDKLQGDQKTIELQGQYKTRLTVLKTIEQSLLGTTTPAQ